MSHVCGRPTSEKVLNVTQKQPQCHPAKSLDSKYFHQCSESQSQHKLKRLKTRKERSQMTGGRKQTRSCHRHCRCQSRRDVTHCQNCSHNSCHFTSRRSTPILSAVPTAQEPSIITDSRLIGRPGLFSHEIKSIDIERLLSEQSKCEKRGEKVKKMNNETLLLSSSSHVSAPLPKEDLFAADANGEASLINKADSPEKSQYVFVEAQEKNPQFKGHGSDVTPELRPQQQNDVSAAGLNAISSPKPSMHAVETFTNANNTISEKDKELNSGLELPQKNQDSQTQTESSNPNSLLDSSSAAGGTFDMQHGRQDSENVSKSVRALAARLCESLRFPLMKKRNLLAECRKVLLKSLQESHGPWLQENLKAVQQCMNLHPRTVFQENREALMEERQLLCADKSDSLTDNKHLNLHWISSPQPQQRLQQTADWFATPMNTFMKPLEETPRLQFCPRFNLDFEPSGISNNDLFPHSPNVFQRETVSTSEDWERFFTRSRLEETFQFNCFESSFPNHTLEARMGSCEPERCSSSILPYRAQLLDAGEPELFPKEPDHFGMDSFPAHISPPSHSRHFQPFRRCREPSPSPAPSSDYTDMRHYPPSYMLERSPGPPHTSSFPSPEHWSFPPMRLY